MRGDWNQKGKRRRWKPKWFRTGWKASTWTPMEKVAMKGSKSKNPEGKAKRQEKQVKKLRARSGKDFGWIPKKHRQMIWIRRKVQK